MQAASQTARQSRAHYRHELRTPVYVALDDVNGGIVRNLNAYGIGLQAAVPPHRNQRFHLRFELKDPSLRVDFEGEVAWAEPSGQCGIRFAGLSRREAQKIKQWIFGNLLESISQDAATDRPILRASSGSAVLERLDGLIVSPEPRPVIELQPAALPVVEPRVPGNEAAYLENQAPAEAAYLDQTAHAKTTTEWLFHPLSTRTLAWLIDSLIMIAAFLLFSSIFLAIAQELPPWPLGLEAALGDAIFVPAFYCAFIQTFGGSTVGARLARIDRAVDEASQRPEEEVRIR
jgi:hypothetical protein